jgi:CheY-like chemotaxis protein
MDLKMPEMDGYEATRRIKAVNAEVPVLALTAYGLVKDQEKALAAGCDDVITKPVDRDLLLHAMKKYLGAE